MGRSSHSRIAWAAALLIVVGCGGPMDAGDSSRPKAATTSARLDSAAPAAPAAPVCVPTGAHGKHDAILQCSACHACGGAYEFSAVTLPGGTSTVGGVITRGSPTTCSVACHSMGGASTSIAWNATGPLACTSCHAQNPGTLSKHAVAQADPVADRNGCGACHVLDQHLKGTVRISVGDQIIDANRNDPAALNAACQACHDGAGKSIAGGSPPVLVGWADAIDGDFHGARAGTGTSLAATLKAPYYRGQSALPCTSCHEPHSSPNRFLLATAGPIDSAGVGAERLCMSCHDGQRHGWCISCHGADPMPAGTGCFYCHGHEGIRNFVYPFNYAHDDTLDLSDPRCDHCHTWWRPPPLEYTAPAIVNGFASAEAIGFDRATITWTTNEPATSYVEWGDVALDHVSGDAALVIAHSVTLTGLSEATTYSFRVRTADGYRNLTRSAPFTFQTASRTAPLSPVIVAEPDSTSCGSPNTVTLEWLPATAPDGDPVQYRVVVDDSPLFDSLYADSGWTSATSFRTSFAVTTFWSTYYWRVQARDSIHGALSPWSDLDQFRVNRYKLGSCP